MATPTFLDWKRLHECTTVQFVTPRGRLAFKNLVSRIPGLTRDVTNSEVSDNMSPLKQPSDLSLQAAKSNEMPSFSNTTNAEQSDQNRKTPFFGDLPRLPSPWERQPIGIVSNPYAEYIDQKPPPRLEMSAAAEGLETNGDNFLFIFKGYDGHDFSATLTNSPSLIAGGSGLMIRKGKAANAPFLFMGVSSNQIIVCRRDVPNGIITNQFRQKLKDTTIVFKLKSTNKSILPAYSIGTWDGPLLPIFPIENTNEMLVGVALWSGSSSNSSKACFINTIAKSDNVMKKN